MQFKKNEGELSYDLNLLGIEEARITDFDFLLCAITQHQAINWTQFVETFGHGVPATIKIMEISYHRIFPAAFLHVSLLLLSRGS
jgi:hypothetical protein